MASKNRPTTDERAGEGPGTAATTPNSDRAADSSGRVSHAVQKAPAYEAPFGGGETVKSLIGTAWGDSEESDGDDDPKAVIDEVWADLTST